MRNLFNRVVTLRLSVRTYALILVTAMVLSFVVLPSGARAADPTDAAGWSTAAIDLITAFGVAISLLSAYGLSGVAANLFRKFKGALK